MTCTYCNGTGELGPYEDCSWCDGTGGRVQTGPAPLPENTRKAMGASIPVAAPKQGADARPVAIYQIERLAREVEVECLAGSGVSFYMVAEMAIERTIEMLAGPSMQIAEVWQDADGFKHIESVIEDLDDIPAGTRLYATRDAAPSEAISDVLAERERQDVQWGGQDHDDQHTKADWQNYIYRQHYAASSFCGTPEQYRVRLVKIAALAVAAIESIDRIAASAPREKT